MKVQVRETTYRPCCQPQDFFPRFDTKFKGGLPWNVICKHCGENYILTKSTDAAGDTDWDYKPVDNKKAP